LCRPFAVALDGTTPRIFVADTGNNRVLSWANTRRLTTGESADLVMP
jgi:hypothetical protein